MNYTIKEFIESNKFPKMQLISDNSGINRVIRGVQILSVPNMEKFLGGGENSAFIWTVTKKKFTNAKEYLKGLNALMDVFIERLMSK